MSHKVRFTQYYFNNKAKPFLKFQLIGETCDYAPPRLSRAVTVPFRLGRGVGVAVIQVELQKARTFPAETSRELIAVGIGHTA